jgi:hypothetical protein
MKQYNVILQFNEDALWPSGKSGLYKALGGPLDNEENVVPLETVWRRLGPLNIDVVRMTEISEEDFVIVPPEGAKAIA